jgi:glycosyltransferase involved in cell wall biosynthesis
MTDVSFLIPAHDAELFVEAAVTSALRQLLPPREVIVVDDGSDDGTAAVVERLARDDGRVRLVRHDRNRGHAAALTSGLAAAQTPLVAILDADDTATPERLGAQVPLFADRRVAVVGGAAAFVDAAGREFARVEYPTSADDARARLASSSPIVHSAATVRAEAVAAVGGYRTPFRLALDYDLWLRLAERYDLVNVPDVVVRYRVHASQGSADLERVAVETVAARAAAARRRAGRSDGLPDEPVSTDELRTLLSLDADDVAAAAASHASWFGKTLARAGAQAEADAVFAAAARLAGGD